MEFIFLGTSSGSPTKQRNVSGLALKSSRRKSWCLVDCGEGTQHQLLHTPLALSRLSAIMITHVHGDHCFGLPGLLASAAMAGRTQPITVVAPAAIKGWLEHSQQMAETHLPFALNFIDVSQLNSPVMIDAFEISTTALSHRVPSFAYGFAEVVKDRALDVDKLKAEQIPAGAHWGQLQNGQDVMLEDGRRLLATDYLLPPRKPRYIIVGGDNDSPQLLSQKASQADVLIHEATYTMDVADRVGSGPQHSCAKQVAEMAEQSGLRHLILTHFSARYAYSQASQPNISAIENEAREAYSGQLFLANDLDHFRLNQLGELSLINQTCD
ncbi:MBL fold metallo-hydrolase [Marinicella sediminis]|uniref:Ribonuclease Z n=1 Tax=Marinicella sediminis TaxID=1792834 RepID=A0ABV7JGS8_9GAMM|nr:MBL fold metallo-hydrolase [Marinicella sediminis]